MLVAFYSSLFVNLFNSGIFGFITYRNYQLAMENPTENFRQAIFNLELITCILMIIQVFNILRLANLDATYLEYKKYLKINLLILFLNYIIVGILSLMINLDFINLIVKIFILNFHRSLLNNIDNQHCNCCCRNSTNISSSRIFTFQGIKEMEERYQIEGDKIYLNPYNKQDEITLEDYQINDKLILLSCQHFFLETPLRQWFNNHQTCPTCRQNQEP